MKAGPEASSGRLLGGRLIATALLLVIAAGSVAAAWLVPAPESPASISLNSEWVFRAEVLVGCFFLAYIVAAVSITTVRMGRPPKRLGLGILAYESEEVEKTVQALRESDTALEVVQERLGEISRQSAYSLAAIRAILRTLDRLAEEAPPELAAELRQVTETQESRLSQLGTNGRAADLDEALARFRTSMRELDRLREGRS